MRCHLKPGETVLMPASTTSNYCAKQGKLKLLKHTFWKYLLFDMKNPRLKLRCGFFLSEESSDSLHYFDASV